MSQDLNLIENSNTVFVRYDLKDLNTEKKIITEGVSLEKNYTIYNYYFKTANGIIDKLNPIKLIFSGSLGSFKDKYLYFRVCKSFLKKNKKTIITKKFIDKIGYKKTKELLDNAKVIFLVDSSEIENNQVLIKQVVFLNIANQ
ncbi:hypothetical protein [Olleya sp. R77988]|uniref:hypothetical protein n=1 Tax=Olleya sp. R77988 TaxID=3093875 RepID=UPI0037C5BC0C